MLVRLVFGCEDDFADKILVARNLNHEIGSVLVCFNENARETVVFLLPLDGWNANGTTFR